MCTSAYDLVCEKCRAKHDEIFKPLIDKGDYTIDEETEAREAWYRCLCGECRKMLVEEGFITAWPHNRCPKCGGPLELRKFKNSWKPKTKKPVDVNENLYCPKCKIRWIDDVGPHTFFKDPAVVHLHQ